MKKLKTPGYVVALADGYLLKIFASTCGEGSWYHRLLRRPLLSPNGLPLKLVGAAPSGTFGNAMRDAAAWRAALGRYRHKGEWFTDGPAVRAALDAGIVPPSSQAETLQPSPKEPDKIAALEAAVRTLTAVRTLAENIIAPRPT